MSAYRLVPVRSVGFTLLEVLISVVVLSVGLLALTALQGALLRASSESKARASAVALATEQLEQMRAFTSVGAASCGAGNRSYKCLTSLAKPSAPNASDSDSSLGASAGGRGGVDFKRWWTVTRYIPNGTGGFSATTDLTASDAATPLSLSEFKVVEVHAEWADANGALQSVVLRDAIAAIDPANSMRLLGGPTGSGRGIQKRIFNPADEAGVIPVATGGSGNEAAAASDPKPLTYGSDGRVSTSFTVQTYTQDSGGYLVQREYESRVVSCRCNLESGAATGGVLEPSYWDGDRYTSPKLRMTGGSVRTNVAWGSVDTRVAQDETLCTVCCRNHHDVDGPLSVNSSDVSLTAPVYSPYSPADQFTTGDHKHYDRTSAAPTFTEASTTSGNRGYDEACRLVRVDGVFRVTADPRLEDVKLLSMSGSPANLDNATKQNYANYASGYVGSLWAQLNGGSSQAALTDATPTPNDGLAQTNPYSLFVNATHDLTARAIFLDWIHPVVKAKAACAGQTTSTSCLENYRSAVSRNVLQILPFLTINMTNLAEWVSRQTSNVEVTNQPIPTIRGNAYSRGQALGKSTTTTAVGVDATTYRGPSALTDQRPINPFEAGIAPYASQSRSPLPLFARREFTVMGLSDSNVANFSVRILGNGTDANFIGDGLSVGVTVGSCQRNGSVTTRHDCAVSGTEVGLSLVFGNYNRVVVSCSAGGASPRDSNDPNTVCVKNNGNESAATVRTYYYKLCSINPQAGITFGTPITGRTNSNWPGTEYTSIPLTITPNALSQLEGQTLTANFYPANSTCP